MRIEDNALEIYISGVELTLLKKLDFPCSERVLASAQSTDEGIQLSGNHNDFESLAGWVAGEANEADRTRARRRAELLANISDQLESALSAAAYARQRR